MRAALRTVCRRAGLRVVGRTDALGNAWFDRTGYEADDKCAWTPSPFIGTGGFAYQYEWSNANNGCVKTR